MVAFVERRWLEHILTTEIVRYELPTQAFVSLDDAGMWVSKSSTRPLSKEILSDLPNLLGKSGVELRDCEALAPLRDAWNSTLHVSGIRLRNALGWD